MQPDRPLDYYIDRLFKQLDKAEFATEMEVQRAYRLLAGDLIYKLTPTITYRNGTLRLRFGRFRFSRVSHASWIYCGIVFDGTVF